MPDDLDAYLNPAPTPRNPRERVHSIASKVGITPDIADDYLKLTKIESGHNINVRDSSKGAKGFGQVMPDVKGGTTRTVSGRRFNLKNPDENIEAGIRYFAEGGPDPVARRLHYFGGPRAKQTYERTGRIPNISDGNMTAAQYVKATGAQVTQQPQKRDAYDDLLDNVMQQSSGQTPPSSASKSAIPPAPSSANPATPSVPIEQALAQVAQQANKIAPRVRRRHGITEQQLVTSSRGKLFEQLGQQRTLDETQRQQQADTRAQVEQEYRGRRGAYGAPTPSGILNLLANPVDSLTGLFRSDEENINRETQERLRQQQVTDDPEVTESRKLYGQMSAPRRVVQRPLEKAGASLLKVAGGITSGLGIAPNQLSEWINRRGELIETAASLPPLAEEQLLTSLITGDKQLKDVDVGAVEKIATGVTDLGLGLGQIILLKRASKLSFPNLLALEAAAKNSDKSAAEQASRAAEGYVLGQGLERLTSRAANAAISGIPTAAQTGEQVSQGRMSPLDAAIQTGIQTGAGALLTPRRRQQVERRPDTQTGYSEGKDFYLDALRHSVDAPVERYVSLARERGASEQEVQDAIQNRTQPPVEAQREAVESRPATTEVGSRGMDVSQRSAMVTPETRTPDTQLSAEPARIVPTSEVATIPSDVPGTTVREPQRFYHRDYGEVAESPNQKRVGKGRVRVVAEDGSEHVIKRTAMTGAGNQRAVPLKSEMVEQPLEQYLEPTGESTKPSTVTEPVTEPSTTSARKSQLAQDRAALDLPDLPPAQRKSWAKSLAEAKPDDANRLADEVLRRPRPLNDSETASLVTRAQQLKNEHARLTREIADSTDDATIAQKSAQRAGVESEFDKLTEATKLSGTEKGRTLAAQKLTINQDFDLVSMLGRFKSAKGNEATPAERVKIEQQSKRIAELELKLAEANDRRTEQRIQEQIGQTSRRTRRTESKAQLDAEWLDLKQQFAQVKAQEASFFKSESGEFRPEAVKLIGKMVRNRIQAGVVDAKQLVDDIYAITGGDKRELRDAISGYSITPKTTRSDLQKQIDALKSELQLLSKTEDIEVGIRSPHREGPKQSEARRLPMEGPRKSEERSSGIPRRGPRLSDVRRLPAEGPRLSEGQGRKQGPRLTDAPLQGPKLSDVNKLKAEGPQMIEHGPSKAPFSRDLARQRAIKKQIADLEAQMAAGEFTEKTQREPPRYTRETLSLQRELDATKVEYERMRYKATRSAGDKISDELAKAANVPKTIKSIGDISAVFRQGGFYALTHPVEGFAKPTRDMLRSFTELGYRNVEAQIKADADYETLKKAGVEFTGIDKDNPHLSAREEGYLGGEYLDLIAKGKYNIPGKFIKGVKDVSERTFVSFLDAQRLYIGKQIMGGLTEAQRNNPAELKAIAKLINSGTGRGNLGTRGNQAAPLLNIALFSPRLLASRVQLLNNMVNPVKMARMPPGARKAMIKDNVKFIGATLAILGLAKSLGATVSTDPDDSEFLKIRIGNTVYDTLTGLQQPLRYILNMARAATGGETYPGESKADLTKKFARSKLSPIASTATSYIAGEDYMGRKFSFAREGRDLVTPLPAKDIIEAFQQEGLLGSVKATPTLVGIGVGSYPPAADKPRTHAEKLARKFIREGMPDEAREEEQIETDRAKAQLRARSRAGENVTPEVKKLMQNGKITEKQAKLVIQARGRTRLSEDIKRLDPNEAMRVYSVMNADEKRVSAASVRQKIANSKADATKKRAFRERARQLGLIQ